MKKKIFSMALILLFAITGTAGSATVMKVGHLGTVHQPGHIGLEKFAELVKQRTNGEIEIQIFPNSQLGRALTQIESVKLGTLHMFSGGLGWFGQFVKDFNITATAFVMKDVDHAVGVMESEIGQDMSAKLIKNHGLRLLDGTWKRPARHVISRTKAVRSVEDVKGMVMRVPDLPSYTIPWKELGAKTVPIPFAEVYLALQQGVADAMENLLESFWHRKFYEPCKYISLTAHQFETVGTIINERIFQKLSAEQQKILLESAKEAGVANNKMLADVTDDYLKKLKGTGIEIITPDRESFFKEGKNIPYVLEEKGIWSKGLYDRVKKLAQ